MTSIKPLVLLVSVVALITLNACKSEEKVKPNTSSLNEAIIPIAPPLKEATAVIVNGKAISKNRIDSMVKQDVNSGRPHTLESKKYVTEQLILQTLVVEDAVKKGLDKLPEVLEQIEMTRESILAKAYAQDFMKNNPVNDDILKAEYDKVRATITGTEYKVRHILVENEAEARQIIAELKINPESFEKMAIEKSKDADSKSKGGDLGWFDLNSVVPEFGAAVANMDKGTVTVEPVKTQFGYHVILLEGTKPKMPPSFDEMKPNLTQKLQRQNLKIHLEDLKAKAKVEIVETPAAGAK